MDNTQQRSRLDMPIAGLVIARIQNLQVKKPDLNLKFSVRANLLQNECFDSFVIRVDWEEEGTQRKKIYLCLTPRDEFQNTKHSQSDISDEIHSLQASFSLYQEFKNILQKPVESLPQFLKEVKPENDYFLILYSIYERIVKCSDQLPRSQSPIIGTFELRKTNATIKDIGIIQTALSGRDEALQKEFVSHLVLEDTRIEIADIHKLLKNALQESLWSQKKWPSSNIIVDKYLEYVNEELRMPLNSLCDEVETKLHEIVRNYLNTGHKTTFGDSSVNDNVIQQMVGHHVSYIIVPEIPPTLRCTRIKQALESKSDRFLIVTKQNLKEWRPAILKNICQNETLCNELILSTVSIDDEVKEFLKCIRGTTCRLRVVSPIWEEETHQFLESLDPSYSSWIDKWTKLERDRLPAFPLRRLAGSSSTHGVLFEAKMAALVALRARRRGLTFQLHANVAAVRPWDDLVLFVDGPGATVTYLVQLKHGEKGGFVSLKAFQGSGQKDDAGKKEEGDFTLIKYFKKFQQLSDKYKDREKLEHDDEWLLCNRNLDDFRFIIYTNKEVEKPSSTPQAGGDTVFPYEDIFETGDRTDTFSFQAGDEVGQMRSDALFQQHFLPRMRVLGAQAHVDRLDALLAEEVRRELCPRVRPAVADECAHLYVQAFKRWLEGPGERVVSQASGELEAAVGEALRRRARAGAGGGALAFQDEHCARVRRALAQAGCVRVRVRVCVAGVRRGHRAAKVLQLLDADFPERWMYVDDQAASDLRVDDLLAASARCPVVVLDVDRVTPQVKDFVSKVAANPVLKLVVLSSHSGRGRDFPGVKWQEISEEWTLEHLIPEAQNKMMDLEVSFQGALMPLRELQVQGAWPEEQLRGGVDGPLLSALIGCDAALGEAPPVDAGAPSHVRRTLHHASVLRREVLGLRDSASDHLVLSGFSAVELHQEEQRQEKQRQEEQQRELRREKLRPENVRREQRRPNNLRWEEQSPSNVAWTVRRLGSLEEEELRLENIRWGDFDNTQGWFCLTPNHQRRERGPPDNLSWQELGPNNLGWKKLRPDNFIWKQMCADNARRSNEPECPTERWTILDENESSESRIDLQFDMICARHAKSNVHLIQNANGILLWRETRGNPEAISKFVVPWSETCKEPYAPRCIHKRSAVETAVKCQQRVSLLLGEPGIGKTSFLCSLAEMQREEEPHKWAVVLKLLDHVDILADLPKGKALGERDVVRLLAAAAGVAAPASSAARRCLEAALFHSGAVHVFVDGVDEVLPAYREKTLRLLEFLVWKTKAERVWVAARPEVDVSLRCLLPSGPCLLMPFSKEEQLDYLQSKWLFANERQDVFERVAKQLLKAFAFTPHSEGYSILHRQMDGHSLLGIPLNLDMVIEAYTDDAKTAIENNSTFHPTRMNQLQLFQQFIHKQREIFKDRYGVKRAMREITYSSEVEDDVFISLHQNYAMLVWTSSTIPLCQKTFQKSVESYEQFVSSEKTGIIWKLEDGRIQFSHYTFVEYFVASWLFEKVTQGEKKQGARETSDFNLKLLLETVYKNRQSRVMVFLDLMLAEGHPFHNAIIENDTETLTSLPSEILHEDLGGRTALHVAAAYGRSDCVNNLLEAGSVVSQSDSLLQWTPLKYASATTNLPTAEILLKKGASPNDLIGPINFVEAMLLNLFQVMQASINRDMGRSMLEGFSVFMENVISPTIRSSPLFVAATTGSKHLMQSLIESGANVNIQGPWGITPLHAAAHGGHKDIVELLLSADANTQCHGPVHYTPIHCACEKGHADVVRLLLSKGADVLVKEYSKKLPIHIAAQSGHKAVVEVLLQTDTANAALQVSSTDENNFTPLLLAIYYGHEEVVETLIENGANVSAETEKEGCSPFQLAVCHGHKEVTEVLLRHGFDINTSLGNGFTALHAASFKGDVDMVRLLLSKGADVFQKASSDLMPIHGAVLKGHREVLELLIQADTSNARLQVNAPAEKHITPLHLAAEYGQKEIAEILIANGANIQAQTEDGDMPIHVSALHGSEEVAEVLLLNGADMDCRGRGDFTPLIIASLHGHENVVRLLMSEGADVFKKGDKTQMAIHVATIMGHTAVVKLLLQRDTSNKLHVNSPTLQNFTPLHFAANKGLKDIVEILIENGANVSGKTEDGYMPIHLSAFHGHKEVMEVLLQHGADINSRGCNQSTPLHCACERGHDDVVKLLLEAGAAVESCNAFGHTPLFSAVRKGHVNVVERLLSVRADVSVTEMSGNEASGPRISNVEILVHEGAHVNARDNSGQSALHLAAVQGHNAVVQVLLSRGADAHLLDEEGLVPLQLALSQKRRDVVKTLLRESFRRAIL